MTALRRRLDLLLGALWGFPCAVTGDRVWPADRAAHERDEHPDRGPCA